MHFIFMPYGKRDLVEKLLRDMESQIHKFPLWNEKKKRKIWLRGAIRTLPFGLHEYIFPREQMDIVLATLLPTVNRYNLGWIRMAILKKIVRVEKLPPFKTDGKFLWEKEFVNIIPIGIRYDKDIFNKEEPNKGWYHEAI